jgi:hypothetical protein
VPLVVGPLHDGLGLAATGVVEQHVEPAEVGQRLVDERLALLGLRHIGRYRNRPAPQRLDLAHRGLERLDTAAREHNVGTLLGQHEG